MKKARHYEIKEVVVNGYLTWTVLLYEDLTCVGGDAHWLNKRWAEQAMRAYQDGVVEHGTINRVEQIDAAYASNQT